MTLEVKYFFLQSDRTQINLISSDFNKKKYKNEKDIK